MIEKPEIKVTRTYSLSPEVIEWIALKAKQIVIESQGEERHNESKIANDILTAAMLEDQRNEKQKKSFYPSSGAAGKRVANRYSTKDTLPT